MFNLPSKKTFLIFLWGSVLGLGLGATLAWSLAKTFSVPFNVDFFTWFSIVSLIINILLIFVTQNQIFKAEKQKEKSEAQIGIWIEYSKAIVASLAQLQNSTHTKDKDILNNVALIELTATFFYSSLNRAGGSLANLNYYSSDAKFAEIMADKGMKSILPMVSENTLGVDSVPTVPAKVPPSGKSFTDSGTKNSKKH